MESNIFGGGNDATWQTHELQAWEEEQARLAEEQMWEQQQAQMWAPEPQWQPEPVQSFDWAPQPEPVFQDYSAYDPYAVVNNPAPVFEPVFDMPEIVGPTSTVSHGVSAPTSYQPSFIDPAWFAHDEQQEAMGQPDMGAGLFPDDNAFFQNPEFQRSNAQFDYTTNPANRGGPGIIGGLSNLFTPDPTLVAGANFLGNLAESAVDTVNPYGFRAPTPSGLTPRGDTALGDLAEGGVKAVLPQSIGELGLEFLPLGVADDLFSMGRRPAGELLGYGTNLDTLPDLAGVVREVSQTLGRVLTPEETVKLYSGIFPSDYETILREGFRPGTALTPDRELADAYAMRRAAMEGSDTPRTLEFRVPKSKLVEDSYYYTSPETLKPQVPLSQRSYVPEGSVLPAPPIPEGRMRFPIDVESGNVADFAAVGASDFYGGNTFSNPHRPRMYGGESQADITKRNRALASPPLGAGTARDNRIQREVMPQTDDMYELGDGLSFDPAALGFMDEAAMNARWAEIDAKPKGTFAEQGKLEAQQEVLRIIQDNPNNASLQFDLVGDLLARQPGFGVKNTGKLDELSRIHNEMSNDSFDNFNFDVLRDATQASPPPAGAVPDAGPSSPAPVAQGAVPAPASSVEPPPPPRQPPASGGNTPPKPGRAGNIRLDKFPEGSRESIKAWAASNADAVQGARRGVIPDAEVAQKARELVEDVGGDWDKLKRSWTPGTAFNAEEILAVAGSLAKKADEVDQLARAAQADDSAINQAKLVAAMFEQAELQQIVHGVKAEAGRALRANRQIVEMLQGNAQADAVRQALDGAGLNRDKIAEVAQALTSGTLTTAKQKNHFIRNLQKPGLIDYVTELWYNAILSSPKTHVINTLTGIANLSAALEKGVAAAVDIPLHRMQGRQTARFFQETPATVIGYAQGIPEGTRAALEVIKTGVSPQVASKIEQRQPAFKGPIGRVINIPSTALQTADAFWFGIHYRGELNSFAVRQARQEGLKGDALVSRIAELQSDPPASMIKAATEAADYRLFRNDPGNFARWLSQGTNKFPVLKLVLPFTRTPTNILKYGLARSPAGLLNPGLMRNIMNGNPEAADQIARAVMGSTVAASLAYGVAGGKITGALPENAAERDRFFREGKLPFAIKIGDNWIQYQRLEPFNQTLSQLAAFMDAAEKGKKVDQLASTMLLNIGSNLVNQSYLTGVSALLNALQDPDRFGGDWVSRTASGFVPASSALRTAAQATDSTVRKPEGLTETIKAGIPGLSSSVPARLDAFGHEVQRTTPAWSPIQIAPDRQTALNTELGRLGEEVGFVGSTIGEIKLSREEKFAYQKAAGQITEALLDKLIQRPAYEYEQDEQRIEVIEKVVSAARASVRESLKTLIESETYQRADEGRKQELLDALVRKSLAPFATPVGAR